ncbi:MAG: hypothetical protein ABIP71_14615, partial [Verrucomicrobiota bacterium]
DATCFDCDYIDDEKDKKASILKSLRTCNSREEWVRTYLRHFPTARELEIIGDYNADRDLPKQWAAFSLVKMQALVKQLRKDK